MSPQTVPYGSWNSPITAEDFTARFVTLSQLRLDQGDTYWVESQPRRLGRNVLLRRNALGQTTEVLPLLEGARLIHVATRVHDYGGRAYAIKNGIVVVSDGIDDRAYKYDTNDPSAQLVPLTQLANCRYGDFHIDEERELVYAVCEDHRNPEGVTNTLVAIPLDGSGSRNPDKIVTVFEGTDFVSSPALSPDRSKISWLTWNHPEMPWTKSELHVGDVQPDGTIANEVVIVDRPDVCVYEPRWTLDGDLLHVDDSTGWANLYRTEGFNHKDGEPADAWMTRLRTRALHPSPMAFSQPHWRLGLHSYDNLDHEYIVCSWSENSHWHIGTMRLDNGLLEEWETGWWPAGNVAARDGRVVYLAESVDHSPAIISVEKNHFRAIRPSTEIELPDELISEAQPVSWPTRDGAEAHGFYYAPVNPDFVGPEGTKPPLVVNVHQGPTGSAHPGLEIGIQFWTSRGFAVLDVNFRGSTGLGREYRSALNGNFGIMDVNDCADGALWLIDQDLVDPAQVVIRGEASGGFTALSAVGTTEIFSAATSLSGISDLREFSTSTSKFQSHYAQRLLQSDDQNDPIWKERSPITHAGSFHAPVLLLQGDKDPLVPLQQTEALYEALVAAGKPVAMVVFPGEGPAFLRAESIELAWRTELSFYGEVLGLEVDSPVKVPLVNF